MLTGEDPDTLFSAGVAALRRGDNAAAVGALSRAVALAPENATAHEALGYSLQQTGQSEAAMAVLRRAVTLDPRLAASHNMIGCDCLARGAVAEALPAFSAALAARPAFPAALLNAGLAHQRLGRIEEARGFFLRAIALQPNVPDHHNALGTALQQLGDPAGAAGSYRRALALNPDFAIALSNLGRALRDLGQVEEAIVQYDRALALQPDYADAHWNRALMLLLSGRFTEGWEEQEWRWRLDNFPSPRRNFAAPLWQGEDLAGATILVHAEQGIGDTLQFLRYAPMVAARGGRVVLEVTKPLLRLAAGMSGIAALVERGAAVPSFSWHAPLLSLPRAFATTPETIPAEVPYLAPPAALVPAWRERLGGSEGLLKVGLVWAGNPTHANDANRSLDPALLAPVLAVPGTRFFSLQVGRRGSLPAGVADCAPHLADFAETAAAVSCLDLVISVDTSTAHLAGALGRPVWTLIPFAPDWRWLQGREDSPWYPSMRLFRQARRCDWTDVVARVAATLRAWAAR